MSRKEKINYLLHKKSLRGNQNMQSEEKQTTQWQKEKVKKG
jgi:hypothetical protein